MKNSFKKLTAWLCCMALLISFIPATALPVFAAEELTTTSSFTTLKTPGNYKLGGNVTASAKISLDGEDAYVLDLGGYTLKATTNARMPIYTLTDSASMTIQGAGNLTGASTASNPIVKVDSADAVLTVKGGTFTSGSSSIDVAAGKLVISGAPSIELVTATAGTVEFSGLTEGASIKLADGITPVNDGSAELVGGVWVYKSNVVKYDITKTAAENGSYTVTVGDKEVTEAAEGDVVTVTATAAAGYLLDTIKVNGEAIDGTTFDMPAEAVTVEVTFKADETVYTVSVGAASNGTVSVDPTEGTYGTTVTVTATPAEESYILKQILVDGEAIDGTTFKITGNHTVTATFIDPNAKTQLPSAAGALAVGEYALNDGNLQLAGAVTISGEVTIDLNGNTLTGAAAPYFTVPTGAKLTIMDSKTGGKVQGMEAAKAMIVVNGEFVLDGGLLTGHTNTSADHGSAVRLEASGAVFTMNGGEISGNSATGRGAAIGTIENSNTHTININGGTIGVNESANGRGVNIYAYTNNASHSKLNITGGTIEMGTKNGVAVLGGNSTENVWVRCMDLTVSGAAKVQGLMLATAGGTTTVGTSRVSNLAAGASIQSNTALTIVENDTTVASAKEGSFYIYTYDYPANAITLNVIGETMGEASVSATEAKAGVEVTVTATPSKDEYVVKSITVVDANEESVAVVNGKFTMPNSAVTVTVEFAALDETQSIVNLVAPTEGGEAAVNVATGVIITAGTEVIVTAEAETGYAITLTVDGEEVELTEGKYTFNAEGTKVHTIVATAAKVDYTVELVYGEGNVGTATLDKTVANYGDTITVTPATGYVLDSMLVNGEAVEGNTFTVPAADVTVTVVIKERPLTAYENLNGVTSGTLPEGKYTLTENQKLTGALVIRATVVIDLAGKTISLADDVAGCAIFNIPAGGKLTVTDSVGGGKVVFKEMASSGGISLTGTFVLEGGELTGWSRVEEGVLKAGGFIDMFADATFKMTGGKITDIKAASDAVIRTHGIGVNVEITGGEISGNDSNNGSILGVGKTGGQNWLHIGGNAVIKSNTMGGNAVPFNYDQIKTVDAIVTIDGNASVEANFQATLGSLTALEGSQIKVSGEPYVKYLRGDSSAKTLFTITELGEEAEIHTSYNFTIADENKDSTVAVKEWQGESGNANEAGKIYFYNYPVRTITLNEYDATMGEASVNPTEAQKGTEITVTATPKSGYAVKSIAVVDENGKAVELNGDKFVMPNSNVTVTVEFAALDETQSIVNLVVPTEGGEVAVNVATGEIIAAGTEVIVTAEAETGYAITLTVDGVEVELTDGQYTFAAEGTKVHNVVATAAKIDYTVELVYGEGNVGTATLNKETANYGDTITVTAAEGYDLISVLVNGEAIEGNTFTMPAANVTVTVVTAIHVIPEYEGLNGATGGELPEGIYTLTENVTLASMLIVKSNVTIDLAGYSITAEANGGIIRVYDANAKLTVKDSVGGGKLISGANEGTPAIDVQAGSFTLDGGEITGWSRPGAGGAVFLASNTSFTMNGGKIVGNTANDRAAIRADKGGHTVTINGGEISGNSVTSGAVARIMGTEDNRSTVVITGGIINNQVEGFADLQVDYADVTISGNPVIGVFDPISSSTATIGDLTEGARVTAAKANTIVIKSGDRTTYTEDGKTYIYAPTYVVEVNNQTIENGEVTLSLVENDEFNADISVLAPAGKKVYFFAAAETGYQLKSLALVDAEGNTIDTEVNLAEGWFIVPAADAKVVAEFETIPADEAVVKVEATENGSVFVDKTGTVAAGSIVTVTVKANLGYRVDKVTVNGQTIATTEGNFTFTAEGGKDYVVVATFTRNAFAITADASVGDKASASATTAKMGDTFTIKAGLDYKLVSVTVTYKDATGADVELVANADGSYTMPAADVVFTVEVEAADPIPEGGVLPTSGTVAEGVYTLTSKHTLTGTLTINGRVVIDLAGRTIQMAPSMTSGAFSIKGRLTIKDSVGGGKIQFKTMESSGGISIQAGGEFILEGGELTGWNRKNVDGVYQAGGFIDMFSNAKFTMTGGKITNIAASGQTVIRCHEAAIGGHKVTITGGEISGNSAISGDIIRMEGAATNRATLTIGGDAKIGNNIFNGEAYTYANYEFQGTNTDFIIEGGNIGVIAPGAGSTVTISGAPVINALRAALNSDGSLKEATSIKLNELEGGALIITGGGLDLSKVTTIPESVIAGYWNNQNELGTQYQGYIYMPAFAADYNQPLNTIELPGELTWAVEGDDAKFDTVGEAAYKVNVNGTTADLMVTVVPQVIDLTQVAVADQIFTGEQIKPELTLKDNYGNEIPADQITVSYGENVELGVGTISYANKNEDGNYVFEGEVSFQIVKGQTDLGYPTGSMMVAIKPNTATTDNAVALTVPAQAGAANVIIGDVTGEPGFVKNISYANGVITFDTEAKPFGAVAQFTVTVETTNYETAQLIVEVKSFEKVLPTGLTATYGDTLADISLAGFDGWRWADPTQSVGNAGVNTFKMYFSNESTTTDVKVTVLPKAIEIVYELTNDTAVIVFDGTAKEPAVTVTTEGQVLAADQYTIEYANNVNAGTATYTIKAGSNYSFADATGTFTIAKATKKLTAQNRGVSAANSATVTVDMGNMLPANRDGANETTYSWNITAGANAIKSVKVEDGLVTIVTKALNQAATATIEVVATSDNYNPITLTIKVELKAAVVGGGDLVAGGGGGGPVGGGSEETEDPQNPDATVETDEKGNKVTTTTDKNGNSIVVVESANGVTATTTSDLYGRYTTSVVIPSSAVTGSEPVVLPVEGKGQATVTVPGTIKVEYPVETVTPGTIAVIVNADGTETLIKDAKQSEDGMVFTLTEDCTVKVYDNAKSFNDLAGHWSGNAVAFVTARGMFAGTGNGTTFSPEVKMTRAMLAQVIYNLEGAEEHNHDANFADVTADAWYSTAVNWAAREGIVSGYSNGTYQPDKALTREEVVQIFYNYAKSKGYDMSHSADLSTFADGHEVSDWAMTAKQWGVGAGLISGKGGNVLDAKGGATRAEGAQMFMNFCQNIAQ